MCFDPKLYSAGIEQQHMVVHKHCVDVSPVPRPLSALLCVTCSTYIVGDRKRGSLEQICLALIPGPYLAFCHLQQANGKLWNKNKANLASFQGSPLAPPFLFFVGARGEPGNKAETNPKLW